ncbi:MAG: hypothetical protein P1V36_08660 [Planctomycetota bacterium]|nr:hypothetical protein [Planctomycetota bacterium]
MDARTRWILVALGLLAAIGLVFVGGHERKDTSADDDPTPIADVDFRLEEPEAPRAAADQSRGIYVLKASDREFTLDLMARSRFQLIVARVGKPNRVARGTWSLVGERLTLAYTSVPGRPEITTAKPDIAVNTWRGRSIELSGTGSLTPVVLIKRTALRKK